MPLLESVSARSTRTATTFVEGEKKLLGIRVVYIIFSSGLSRWGGVIYSSTHPHTHTPTHQALVSPEQERQAKEQQELNDLADTDPAEYDRRIKEWRKRKLEGRDGSAGRGVGGGDGDGGADIDEIGDVERRKSLARERREARYSINSSVVANSTWYIYMYILFLFPSGNVQRLLQSYHSHIKENLRRVESSGFEHGETPSTRPEYLTNVIPINRAVLNSTGQTNSLCSCSGKLMPL